MVLVLTLAAILAARVRGEAGILPALILSRLPAPVRLLDREEEGFPQAGARL